MRKELGLTQEKPAYEAGLASKGHLSGIGKGLVLPTLPTLALIAERMSVDLVDLLTFPEGSERHALVDLTRSMKAETVRRILREARG